MDVQPETEDLKKEDCSNVVLFSDQLYLFKSTSVGQFRIRGGCTGNITVDGNGVKIRDGERNVIFDCGSLNDRIELKDEDGRTTVKVVQNGAKFKPNFERSGNSVTLENKKLKVNKDELSSDDRENPGTLQIVGCPNEEIILVGHRPVVVTGNGGYLELRGTSTVTVKGDLQKVVQIGISTVNVLGDVTGDVSDVGIGRIKIEGDVHGSVTSEGMGCITIKGNVYGTIRCKGHGSVEVLGLHLNGGKLVIEDSGHASIGGAGKTNFVNRYLSF